jgi:outer membrane protein TolC
MTRALVLMMASCAALAQEPLTLKQAVREALLAHPSQQAAAAGVRAAEARVDEARAGYLPRAGYTEFFQTSNQPVFAFGALLNQRRFAESNFAIDSLNHPGMVNNFQSQVSVEQTIWDFGGTRTAVHSAQVGQHMAEEQQRFEGQQRIVAVARAYHSLTLAREGLAVAQAAVKSAQASLERAEAVRDAGMGTDADVLSVRVHLAAVRELEIRRKYETDVALAALNETMGAPLDSARQLGTPLTVAARPSDQTGERPELRQARLARELSEAQRSAAIKAYYPQIVARSVFEADRGTFATQAGANWFLGAGLKWNLFDGATRRRVEEAGQGVVAAQARERDVAAKLSLQLHQAQAGFASAQERLAVADAAVAEAEESLRIVRNRYEAGLARVDELLHNEVAVLETRMRRIQAIFDQRMAAVEVELAAGTLTEGSDVLE